MRKVWDIHGGVHPAENKTQSNSTPIGKISLPNEIILPVSQHIGSPAITAVSVGDHVLKGQKVAEPQGHLSAPVHAPTSGTVIAIENRAVTHPSGLSALCVVIKPDGKDEWVELFPCKNYLEEDKQDLIDKIRDGGLAGMGGAGFPTAIKLTTRTPIDTLILNGTECEPYITADDVLMRERADEIILGAELFAFLLNDPKIIIGIEDNKPEAVASMRKAAEGKKNIEVVEFPTKYPSGGEKQLIQILTGKEVPSDGLPAEVGIVVQNVGTALTAYRSVRFGEPLISRVTTVVGESLEKQGNVDALLGTPIQHLLDQFGFDAEKNSRVIIGGPMMGFTVESTEAPVVKTTNCILAPTEKELPAPPPANACIRCGMCSEACPASLLPQQLYWFSRSENFDALESHNLFDCIECGACSFVCPSNIPLVQYYRASKGTIRQLKSEKDKSDRSRERFEFRKSRIAKAEAEKEAKRQARKKAAEEAKKALAEKPTAPKTAPPAKTADDTEKLERAVASAQLRVDSAKQKLQEAEQENLDASRVEALKAKVKQTEQKLSDAQARKADAAANKATDPGSAGEKIIEKIELSPVQKLEKSLESVNKRLDTAKQKLTEAEQNSSPTVDALKTGVQKLEEKRQTIEKELQEAKASGVSKAENEGSEKTLSAAEVAIEKAKSKAAELANMSDEEKAAANIASLESRLKKARERLAKAEAENSEHLEAFKNSVTKLELKLSEAQNKTPDTAH